MPRHARIIVPGVPHHVTQRSNKKIQIFHSDADRKYFLEQLLKYAALSHLELLSFCLMSNHTHLIVIPRKSDSLAKTLKPVHMKYSQKLNRKESTVGCNWQGRFFSAPMDYDYTWRAIQYVCLNPVRAGVVKKPEDSSWSSANIHLGNLNDNLLTAPKSWKDMASKALQEITTTKHASPCSTYDNIRVKTHKNLPIGQDKFIEALEHKYQRRLMVKKAGRPRK